MIQSPVREKILIVDDEDSVRSILLKHLESEGAECVTSPNGYDALDKIREEQFSLIISDLMMPGMSGMELLQHVKDQNPETAFIIITGLMDISAAIDSLRIGAFDFITKPFELPAICGAVNRALERRRLVVENRYYQEKLEREIRDRTFALNAALHDVEESYKITLEALVTALDAREHETQAHSQRVREYTLTLAVALGLKDEELVHVGRGALLHDVGKIGVRDSILLKPAKLSKSEWVEMRMHPQIGYEILRNIEFLSPAAEIVLCHQERWDGKGYPGGLAGDKIPLSARIFAVVDTLDAMTSDRPYRKALPFETALNEIRNCSGTQFDPRVSETFLEIPAESWLAIHDSVNKLHQDQDSLDALCPNSTTSR
jgi:response regulator RpfG family c-di-GMP phosphodiesterase